MFLIPGIAAGADGKYLVEMVPPEPIQVPKDALVVPYRPDAAQQPDQVLVPFERFKELWKAANPEELAVPPAPYAMAGGAYAATLLPGDALSLRGSFTVNVFAADGADVPLPLDGGVLESVMLDGAPAMVRSAPRPDAAPGRQTVQQAMRQQSKQQVQGQQMAAGPAAQGAASFLYIPEPGAHKVELVARLKINRQGGWRSVDGRLPAPPAALLDLRVPDAQTEVLLSELKDRPSYRTQAAGETIATALGDGGRLRIQWRPVIAEGEIDRTLTAESSVLLDVQEDGLYEVWNVVFRFRRGERDFFTADVPPEHIVEKVTGGNVKGWETADPAGSAGAKRITVRLLKAAENQEEFCVVLRRPMKLGGDQVIRAQVPSLAVPDAVRHTGRITIRNSPLLVARAMPGQGVRRTDLAAPSDTAALVRNAAEQPLGVLPYQTYEFMAVPFELASKLSGPAPT
jgi:hypothetical protein